jgi:hypothetical protein
MSFLNTLSHHARNNLFEEDVKRDLQEWERCASP